MLQLSKKENGYGRRKGLLIFVFLIISSRCQDEREVFIDCGQMGDEKAIDLFFNGVNDGYYVDIGGFDPIVLSNSLNLHSRGWGGVNVEANPDRLKPFYYQRPDAINLNVAIGPETDTIITLYELQEFSTISFKMKMEKFPKYNKEVKVLAMTLGLLCDRYFLKRPNMMSLDIEGVGFSALQKNNWQNAKCSPQIIVAQNNLNQKGAGQKPAEEILVQKGYKLFKRQKNQLNEYYIHQSVYDKYVEKFTANTEYNKKNKRYFDFRQFVLKVVNVIVDKNTTLNKHYSPFNQHVYLHAAKRNEILDIQRLSEMSNSIQSIPNRPILIFNFNPLYSFILMPSSNYTMSQKVVQNLTFLVLTDENWPTFLLVIIHVMFWYFFINFSKFSYFSPS